MHHDEPVTIDWVVECRYRARSGEMKGYIRETVNPYVFGVTTRDGGMAMMVAPAYCKDQRPRNDFVPLLMWGDKAGDFSSFLAFVSLKAFENPSVPLKPLSIELRPADEAEFNAWQLSAPKNVVPSKSNPFLTDMSGVGVGCGGVMMLTVPDRFRALIPAQEIGSKSPYVLVGRPLRVKIEESITRAFENYTPYVRGYNLKEIPVIEVYPENILKSNDKYEVIKGRIFTNSVQIRKLDDTMRGIVKCQAAPPDVTHFAKAIYRFPDGDTPEIEVQENGFARGNTFLFASFGLGFDLERGEL